jgi:hypothetical protein
MDGRWTPFDELVQTPDDLVLHGPVEKLVAGMGRKSWFKAF